MSVDKTYQTYYGIFLDHYADIWGGNTYHTVLVKEFPSEYLSSPSHSSATDTRFEYPSLWKNKYYIDGTAEGHVSFYNINSTTTYKVSRYGVELIKTIDAPSSETVIGSYTYTFSSPSNIAHGDYLTVPVFMNISKQLVEENERLLLRVYFYNNSATASSAGYVFVACANDSTIIDMQIKIPYAYSG
jgi:hypothetical protein